MVVARVEQAPPESDRKLDARAIADERFGHVVGLAERPRHVAVVDLPLVLLRVADPRAPAAVVGGPQPRLEAELELGFGVIEVVERLAGRFGERRERRVVHVVDVARRSGNSSRDRSGCRSAATRDRNPTTRRSSTSPRCPRSPSRPPATAHRCVRFGAAGAGSGVAEVAGPTRRAAGFAPARPLTAS